ncbi:chymotrypsin-C-like [Diachasmimorpha longicaudata]|uniref:chymotrypsin-C-like n=1 Tax=Diachasmimorpha longicaudata TaxID=58733 RepID=UPI0030B8E262
MKPEEAKRLTRMARVIAPDEGCGLQEVAQYQRYLAEEGCLITVYSLKKNGKDHPVLCDGIPEIINRKIPVRNTQPIGCYPEDVNGERVKRILNADDATAEEFPSNAFIRSVYIRNGLHYPSHCSGSLVTPSHILTVAHCTVYLNQSENFVYYRVANEIVVKVGMNSAQDAVYQYSVKRIYRHEKHHALIINNPWVTYDIAILELHEHVDLGPTQQIINLPCYQPDLGDQGTLVASGRTSLDSPLMGKLTKAVFKVVECDDWVVFGIICIWSETAKVMPGDSGSAFIINNRIFGIAAAVPFKRNYYILTDVFHYFDWIVNIIGLPDEFDFLSGVY